MNTSLKKNCAIVSVHSFLPWWYFWNEPLDERKACVNLLLVVQIFLTKEVDECHLFKMNSLIEKWPGCKSISNSTKWVHKNQLGANAPPEPSHIAWMSKEFVSSPRHQFMAIMPLHLDYMVEIGLGCEHCWLSYDFTPKANDNSNNTDIPDHLHIWEQPTLNEKLTPAGHCSDPICPAVVQEIGIQSKGLGITYCCGEVLWEVENGEYNHIPSKNVVGDRG